MAALSIISLKLPSPFSPPLSLPRLFPCTSPHTCHLVYSLFPSPNILKHIALDSFCISYRCSSRKTDSIDYGENYTFDEAVSLFNGREYYRCHDVLEAIWNESEEPLRTLVHGILQCAVGFHHLFDKNHKGAMMELGEGLCKLRKMNFEGGPFHKFEQEVSAVLEFIYQTQLELAACTDDFCIAMDQSDRSYQLLGKYAAGQHLYGLESDLNEIIYIVFCSGRSYGSGEPPVKVKLPTLLATEEHLMACQYN